MELGTKKFNDSAMEMFGGKPKQQTAMQELIDFIESQEYNFLNKEQLESCNKIKEKAEQLLEIEKQQIIDARVKIILDSNYVEAEQYYNETFKNK